MNELIEIVKIGGPAVSTAVIFLWYLDRYDKRNNTLISNHFTHVTDAMNRNTGVLERLATLIDFLLQKRKRK